MRVRLGWACENSHSSRMARIAAAMFVMLMGLAEARACRALRASLSSEAEGPEGVEEAMRVLKVHVVASSARLAMATLKEQDLLSYSGGDSGSEAALASRDAGETTGVRPAGAHDAPECVCEHLGGQGVCRGDCPACRAVAEPREQRGAVRTAGGRVRAFLAEGRDADAV